MQQQEKPGRIKHIDFIILDMFCLQVAFVIAYLLRHGMASNPYESVINRSVVIVLAMTQLIFAVFGNNYKNILQRGIFNEFENVLRQSVGIILFGIGYLFLIKSSTSFSRTVMFLTGIIYLVLSYIFRLIWKQIVRGRLVRKESRKSLLVITTSNKVKQVLECIRENSFYHYQLIGMVLLDEEHKGENLHGVEVVAGAEDVVDYVCRSWVDEVLINVEKEEGFPQEILDALNEMGVTTHLKLQGLENPYHREQTVQRVVGYSVLTYSVASIPENQLAMKRALDIIGGVVGCLFCAVLTLVLGPIIFIASPGPIFFSQTRIGQNGKPFKIYKFRSMYIDAEARKAELMSQNQMTDDRMFKIEDDPRIIKGVGHFIRKTSLDEFPQFFNVLKGDMSLVGTRPPTTDEWVKYDLHHRLRMVMRPGITGLWQVSGRSDIKEFEEVVRLDAEYIANWTMGRDLKIILKTIWVIFKQDGAR